jgi:hypothetical protein
MTPEEKAKELIAKYKNISYDLDDIESHKESALIAVNELENYLPSINGRPPNYQDVNEHCSEYWTKVKIYINMYIK